MSTTAQEHIAVNEKFVPPEVELEVIPSSPEGDSSVMVRVRVPESTPSSSSVRPAVEVCCVIDVSGSMGTDATYEGPDGQTRSDGMNILDIVRHSVKMVVASLQPGDGLAIVPFGSSAMVALPLTHMDDAGKAKANSILDRMSPGGGTNMWDGLQHGFDALRAGQKTRLKTLMLLTDGQPDTLSEGYENAIQRYMNSHRDFHCEIDTFGFGYSLDSKLLHSISVIGGGSFAFIPDALVVGTTFVHSLANALSTHSQVAAMALKPLGGAEITGPVGGALRQNRRGADVSLDVGPLRFGTYREIVVPMKLPPAPADASKPAPYLRVQMQYGQQQRITVDAAERQFEMSQQLAVEVAALRSAVVEKCYEVVESPSPSPALLAALVQRLKDSPAAQDEQVRAIFNDVSGRLSKSLDGAPRFNRWGKHYLRANSRSHQIQTCTNNKDPGVQVYGGELFAKLRAIGDRIFAALPPPKTLIVTKIIPAPAASTTSSSSSSSAAAAAAPAAPAPVDMSSYNDACGGCFAGHCTVTAALADGSFRTVAVQDVRKGDRLVVSDGGIATVLCVMQTASAPVSPLFELAGGLTISGAHPVRLGGVWVKPSSVGRTVASGSSVFNFVLDRCHVLVVNGMQCVTLGHGITEEGAAHRFYGTSAVIRDLMAMPGWQDGRVVVDMARATRDAAGHIVSLFPTTIEAAVVQVQAASVSVGAF